MKSLVMVGDGKPALCLLRGDHQLSETKLAAVLGVHEVRPAHPQEIREWFGADPGSLGPVGVTQMPILADLALEQRRNMICGANEDDYHLRHVTPGEDFSCRFVDLRQVVSGDTDIATGEPLEVYKAVEIGHIFKLGYKYSESMGLRVLDADGKEITPIMGSYGIGIERILCAAIELYHDKDGMVLPVSIAPFEVVVTPVNMSDAGQREAAERIYAELKAAGLDVLLDDRDERPGVKFKDADLIGIPFRVTVGKKLAAGQVEVVKRRSREAVEVAVADTAATLVRMRHGG
jgi:prolyl-tRNA synthetase